MPDRSPDETYFSFAKERLSRLYTVVHGAPCPESAIALVHTLFAPWGDRPLPTDPTWKSDISDDHTPFEFSLALERGKPQLRLLFEPQGPSDDLAGTIAAARDLHGRMRDYGASFERLDRVLDSFVDGAPEGRFAIWYGVAIDGSEKPDLKVYLNPRARGPEKAYSLVEQAFERLGLQSAWTGVAKAARRSPPLDEIRYFSLDLSAHEDARLKVYVYHHGATIDDLERAAEGCVGYSPGIVGAFCTALAAHAGPYRQRPPATCVAFAGGDPAPTATLHFPVRNHVSNDAVVKQRVAAYLESNGIDAATYGRALDALRSRELEAGSGLSTYASLRIDGRPERPRHVTVYLATEAFATGAPRAASVAEDAPLPAEEIVAAFDRDTVAGHPFFQRMRRHAVDFDVLYRLMANTREGMVRPFCNRLAYVIARTEDVRIRSILAKQLNDELGKGDATQAHVVLFDRLVDGIAPFASERARVLDDRALAPGRALAKRLFALYAETTPLEGVGASIVVELMGEQGDVFVADEFRRQTTVPKSALTWLDLHEELEKEHSSESLDLAKLVPADDASRRLAWRGAIEVRAAVWSFLDQMYPLCWGDEAAR